MTEDVSHTTEYTSQLPGRFPYGIKNSSYFTENLPQISHNVTRVTEISSRDVTRDDDNDDASSCGSDDTVYESDAIEASQCCTPVCDTDTPVTKCDAQNRMTKVITSNQRNYRSTSPPSRNVTPVTKEGLFKFQLFYFRMGKDNFSQHFVLT